MQNLQENNQELGNLILSLFHSNDNQPVIGKTMLMKQIFILTTEIVPRFSKIFDFFPAKFGPYSNIAAELVNHLKREGKISGTKDGRELRYEITDLGINELNKRPNLLSKDQIKKIGTMKEATQQWGLKKTLRYVYTRYPEFTPRCF